MIKHYITKYYEDDNLYAESWIQINLLNKSWCVSKRKIKISF